MTSIRPYEFKELKPRVVLHMPSPPSVNAMYGTNWATKRRFTSKEGEVWFSAAADEVKRQLPPTAPVVPGAVRVLYEYGRIPDGRKRDLLNLEKAATDLLVKLQVIEDDSRVQEATLRWVDDLEPRRARITVVGHP
jgi:Holliday junction resolvase RusA-like endonuclease